MGTISYQVRSGDTLSAIAGKYRVPLGVLVELNHIVDPNKIFTGQRLQIPVGSNAQSPAGSTGTGSTGMISYQVRSGDTLSAIAGKYRVPLGVLVELNHIVDPNRIFVGQRLQIPVGSSARPPADSAGTGSASGTRGQGTSSSRPGSVVSPNMELGSLSRKYEAQGPGTVSTGSGDNGGVSYGSYQFASKTGSVQEFVSSLKTTHPEYYKVLAGKTPGSAAFTTAWKDLARRDPRGFDKAQHDYIKVKYYDVACTEVKKATGLDVNTRSYALRNVIWSTAVQHGARRVDDFVKVALKGGSASAARDEDLIKGIYAERGRRNASGELAYFSSCSQNVQEGVARRFREEQKDALAMLKREQEDATVSSVTPAQGRAPVPARPAPAEVGSTPVVPPGTPKTKRVSVPYYSQYEKGHGFKPGDTSCFDACKAMAAAVDAREAGPGSRIQIGTSENSTGRITVDRQRAVEGQRYIDQQLNLGKPVIVGVSHMDSNYNVDKLTDHFVVITGRGVDAQGRTYYTFHDPGTRNADVGRDTNANNRFYVDPGSSMLYRPGKDAAGNVTQRRYDVAMVRRNA